MRKKGQAMTAAAMTAMAAAVAAAAAAAAGTGVRLNRDEGVWGINDVNDKSQCENKGL